MPQLDTSTFPSQIFWLTLCFGILCFAIVSYLAPRLGRSLESRSKQIEDYHQKAEKLLAEARELSESNKKKMEVARHESSQHLSKLLMDLTHEREQQLHELEDKFHKKANDLQVSLNKSKQEILKSSGEIVTNLVCDMFQQITGKSIDTTIVKASTGKGK